MTRRRSVWTAFPLAAAVVALVPGCSCGLISGDIKPRTLNIDAGRTVQSGAQCGTQPLPPAVVDLEALLRDAEVDLSQGCLRSLSFGLVADALTLLPAPGCALPRGTASVDRLVLELTCADDTREALSVPCADRTLDFTDVDGVYDAYNRCLDVAEVELAEPLRQAANRCRPKRLEVGLTGTCSADTCVDVRLTVGFRLISAVAQLGGTCP